MTTASQTSALGDGLRALATMVDANPDVAKLLRYCMANIIEPMDTREEIVAFTRAAMKAGASIEKYQSGDYAGATALFGPLALRAYTSREQICERVVVGTREVTEEVPDPAVVAAAPTVTITKTVEDVEWRCMPLLAEPAALPVGA